MFLKKKKNQLFNCLTLQLKTVYSNQTLVEKKSMPQLPFLNSDWVVALKKHIYEQYGTIEYINTDRKNIENWNI